MSLSYRSKIFANSSGAPLLTVIKYSPLRAPANSTSLIVVTIHNTTRVIVCATNMLKVSTLYYSLAKCDSEIGHVYESVAL